MGVLEESSEHDVGIHFLVSHFGSFENTSVAIIAEICLCQTIVQPIDFKLGRCFADDPKSKLSAEVFVWDEGMSRKTERLNLRIFFTMKSGNQSDGTLELCSSSEKHLISDLFRR